MRVYKFGEFDLYNQREEDGLVSIDGTVFVSDGGYFKGIVQDHGTLIVRGGEADVIIGQNGKVSAVGGKLHAVVDLNGQLDISEGTVEVEEQGGLVRIVQSYARITFLKSVVKGIPSCGRVDLPAYTRLHSRRVVLLSSAGFLCAKQKQRPSASRAKGVAKDVLLRIPLVALRAQKRRARIAAVDDGVLPFDKLPQSRHRHNRHDGEERRERRRLDPAFPQEQFGEREGEPTNRKVRDPVIGIADEAKRFHEPIHRHELKRVVCTNHLKHRPDEEAGIGRRRETELPAGR